MCGITIWLLHVTRIAILYRLGCYVVYFVTQLPSFRGNPVIANFRIMDAADSHQRWHLCNRAALFHISEGHSLNINWRVTWNVKLSLPPEVIVFDGNFENFYGVDEEN